jgi:hypothetical protein
MGRLRATLPPCLASGLCGHPCKDLSPALALRTKPQQKAKLESLATNTKETEKTTSGSGPNLAQCSASAGQLWFWCSLNKCSLFHLPSVVFSGVPLKIKFLWISLFIWEWILKLYHKHGVYRLPQNPIMPSQCRDPGLKILIASQTWVFAGP